MAKWTEIHRLHRKGKGTGISPKFRICISGKLNSQEVGAQVRVFGPGKFFVAPNVDSKLKDGSAKLNFKPPHPQNSF
jgi:hypothetical protein